MEVLGRFGLGNKYLKWLTLLYMDPTAEILTNNQISQPFRLHRGTRQGCPLSPLLFLFAIEPLALAIRQHPHVLGVKIEETEHIISLFADDIIIYLSNLTSSIPTLVSLIESFGRFSGYKVNNSKSTILFLNERQNPQIITPFSASQDDFALQHQVYICSRTCTLLMLKNSRSRQKTHLSKIFLLFGMRLLQGGCARTLSVLSDMG